MNAASAFKAVLSNAKRSPFASAGFLKSCGEIAPDAQISKIQAPRRNRPQPAEIPANPTQSRSVPDFQDLMSGLIGRIVLYKCMILEQLISDQGEPFRLGLIGCCSRRATKSDLIRRAEEAKPSSAIIAASRAMADDASLFRPTR